MSPASATHSCQGEFFVEIERTVRAATSKTNSAKLPWFSFPASVFLFEVVVTKLFNGVLKPELTGGQFRAAKLRYMKSQNERRKPDAFAVGARRRSNLALIAFAVEPDAYMRNTRSRESVEHDRLVVPARLGFGLNSLDGVVESCSIDVWQDSRDICH